MAEPRSVGIDDLIERLKRGSQTSRSNRNAATTTEPFPTQVQPHPARTPSPISIMEFQQETKQRRTQVDLFGQSLNPPSTVGEVIDRMRTGIGPGAGAMLSFQGMQAYNK